MKTLDAYLGNFKVLSVEESVAIRGGIVWTWAGAAVTLLLIPIITSPQVHIDAFLKGMNEGYTAVKESVK